MSHNESSVVISNRQTQTAKDSEIADTNRETLILKRISEEEGRLEDTINSNSVTSAIKYKQSINKEIEVSKVDEAKALNKIENIAISQVNQIIQDLAPQETNKVFQVHQEQPNTEKPNVNTDRRDVEESARQQQNRQIDIKRKEKQKQKMKLQQKLKELEKLERMLAEKEMRSKK